MTGVRTYLDYNATAPLRPVAREAMLAALAETGNPSSVHAEGRRARDIVETAREQVARLVNAKPSEVVFTASAAEANAMVLAAPWTRVFASRIEHDTVLAGLGRPGREVVEIPAGDGGRIDLEHLARRVTEGPSPLRGLLTLQFANNETGVVQPVAEAVALADVHALAMHCDAAQAAGRLPVDFAALGIAFMTLSAHKIGGPKGVGALLVRDGASLPALIPGGQERRRRGGTENVAAIAGFGAAAEEALAELSGMARIAGMRDRMEARLTQILPHLRIVGSTAPRLPNTSCFAVPGLRAETLVIRLDLAGCAVSAGAACSSGKVGASHVLAAMGLPPEVARSAIRVSLGRETTERDIDTFLAAMATIAAPAKSMPGLAGAVSA